MLRVEDPELFRNNIRKSFHSILTNESKSKHLEQGIFNFSLNEAKNRKIVKKWDNPYFIQIYSDRVKTIHRNIKKSQKLIDNILNSKRPHEFAYMTHQEMDNDKWASIIEKKMKIDKNKYETKMEASTDTFTCRKCKSKECTYYQMQTRSADEPMTTFVTCINCNNRWKC